MSLSPEDEGRANFYALLSRLFYGAPDAGLLAALGQADKMEAEDRKISETWDALAQAAASADPELVRDEYHNAFVTAGRPPVTLYTTAYSVRYANEVPLATLRSELAALGLARRNDAGEPEDHIAALCDTMRYLVTQRDISDQQRFFSRWIQPVFEALCNAIEQSEQTNFYKSVARMAKAFFSLERSGFEML